MGKLGRPLSFSKSGTSWGLMLYHGTPQHFSMVSWLVPTKPSDLNPNVHEASSKFLSRRFFSDEFALGGIPTWKRVTITSPVAFQVILPAINKA